MQILYFLESIRFPTLDTVMSLITQLGDETLFIAVTLCVYWCVSKKWGSYVLVVSFASLFINQLAKIICGVPRPWVQYPDFTIVESARARATGYSFPSGHTANIAATLGSCARFTKRRGLRAAFLVIIALVSFSRMYLGVHYPADVLFSLAVTAVLVFALYALYTHGKNMSRRLNLSFLVMAALSLGFVLFVNLHAWPADIDAANLASAKKNTFLMVGCTLGMIVGTSVDRRWVNFRVDAPWWAQILKAVLGLAVLIGIKGGLKLLLPADLYWTAPRYFLVTVFAACVWPLTFPWFARGCRKKPSEAA